MSLQKLERGFRFRFSPEFSGKSLVGKGPGYPPLEKSGPDFGGTPTHGLTGGGEGFSRALVIDPSLGEKKFQHLVLNRLRD